MFKISVIPPTNTFFAIEAPPYMVRLPPFVIETAFSVEYIVNTRVFNTSVFICPALKFVTIVFVIVLF